MDPRIADFIAEHRGTYTREAITQQLLDAGYSREAIDATWKVLDTPDPDDTAGEAFWPRFFLILVGINAAVIAVVGLTTGAFFSSERLGYIGILLVAMAIGALIAWGIVAAVGPSRLGRTTATVIGVAIPLIFALLIGGACYALLSALGPPSRSGTMQLEIDGRADLSGTGTANCTVRSPTNFDVFGQRSGERFVSFSVNAIPGEAQALDVSVFIVREPASETDRGEAWSTYAPVGGASVQTEVGRDGLEGTVTFADLPSDQSGEEFEGPDPEPISGTQSWSCD